jgi:hypothetical protein
VTGTEFRSTDPVEVGRFICEVLRDLGEREMAIRQNDKAEYIVELYHGAEPAT